jgi:hypothetical protein
MMRAATNTRKLVAALFVAGYFVAFLLSAAVYIYGIYLADQFGSTALLLVSFVPVLGQGFLVWSMWSVTGVFFNSYTIALLSLFALAILLGNLVRIFESK